MAAIRAGWPGWAARWRRGYFNGGVLPVLKHIPGDCRATQDSHVDLPHIAAAAEDLAETDFAPFLGAERSADGDDRASGL